MEYNFIRMKSSGAYANVIDKANQSRFLSFTSKQSARVYIKHLCKFRATYGYWFRMDFSNNESKYIRKPKVFRRHTPESLEKYLGVDTYDDMEFEKIYSTYNMSLLHCDQASIISGGHENHICLENAMVWDCEPPDMEKYAAQLDKILQK